MNTPANDARDAIIAEVAKHASAYQAQTAAIEVVLYKMTIHQQVALVHEYSDGYFAKLRKITGV